MTWAAVATIGGTYLANQQQSSAADKAAQRSSFSPYNVTTGFGSGTFDGKTATSQLNPEYQSLRDRFLGGANKTFDAYQDYNPDDAMKSLLEKMRGVSRPGEERERLGAENRLFKQGMLGSTGGASQMGEIRQAQGMKDLMREIQAFTQAQQVQDQLQGRGMKFLQGASTLDDQAIKNLELGGRFGGMSASAGAKAAQFPWEAAKNTSDATAAFWGGLGG